MRDNQLEFRVFCTVALTKMLHHIPKGGFTIIMKVANDNASTDREFKAPFDELMDNLL